MLAPNSWLRDLAPGFRKLTRSERRAVSDFVMLWSVLEAQALDCNASAGRMLARIAEWDADGLLDGPRSKASWEHFAERLRDGEDVSHRFTGLRFGNAAHVAQVRGAILHQPPGPGRRERHEAMALIVHRIRNNLLNGKKWSYGLADQEGNFRHASHMLMLWMDAARGLPPALAVPTGSQRNRSGAIPAAPPGTAGERRAAALVRRRAGTIHDPQLTDQVPSSEPPRWRQIAAYACGVGAKRTGGAGFLGPSRPSLGLEGGRMPNAGEFDAVRGFAGDAPGQDVARVVARLTLRDLELIVGPAVLPLLPPSPPGDRTALEAAATRVLRDGLHRLLRDPTLRRTILRNLDPGKAEELRHRLDDPDPDAAAKDANWPAAAGFFGLDAPDAAAAPSPVPVEELEVASGLFPHQRSVVRRALARIGDGRGRTLIHMPTGAGKTRTAMNLVSRTLSAGEPAVVVWLASSRELVEQAAEAFQLAWRSLGDRALGLHRFWGAYRETPETLADGLLVAGLAKTHAWRERDPLEFQRFAARVDLVVIDEAHQAIAPTYRALIDDLCGAGRHHALLGLTATPGRTWNDVTADQELSDYFGGSKVVLETGDDPNPVHHLLAEGYLAKPTFAQIGYAPEAPPCARALAQLASADEFPDDMLEGLAESTARNLAIIAAVKGLVERGHLRIILFAVSVCNASNLADALVAHGIAASVVTGETTPARRAAILRSFKSASPKPMVVCNFGVLTTGFDAPRTSAAVIARPTKSLVLFSQMVGRATRGPKAGGNETSEILTVHDPSYPGFGDIAEAFFNWEDVWSDE